MHVPEGYEKLERSLLHAVRDAKRVAAVSDNETLDITIRVRRPLDAPPLPEQEDWGTRPIGRRHFLTREELAARYGASQAELDAVVAFVRSHGLTVTEVSAARRSIFARGTARQMREAFAVEIGRYESPEYSNRGREGYIHVPKSLVDIIQGVFGLDDRPFFRAHSGGGPPPYPGGGPPGATPLDPPTVARLCQFPPIPTNISSQAVAVFEFVGTPAGTAGASAGLVLDSTTGRPSDVDAYLSSLGIPPPNVVVAPGVDGAPTGAIGTLSSPQAGDIECVLDVDVVASVAVGATVVVYCTPNTAKGWVDVVTTAVGDTTNKPSVISISAGSPELWNLSSYMLRRWDRFARFIDDGRICLTNNAAERALRGFALGRKSWLFAGSERGADRAAVMATLIVTCLCRARHNAVYAARRTMPNGRVFPRIHGDRHVIGSA